MSNGQGYWVQLSSSSAGYRYEIEKMLDVQEPPEMMLMFDAYGNEQRYVSSLDVKYGWRPWRPNGTLFEYRRGMNNGNDYDNNQLWLAPHRWSELNDGIAGTYVHGVVNNEPNHQDLNRTSEWHIAVMEDAHPRGIRTAIGGYAYGHPENHTDYSPFERMIRKVIASKGMAHVAIHEYALKGTYANDIPFVNPYDVNTWPRSVPAGQRWRLGRVMHWLNWCRSRGVPDFPFTVDETGWATRGDMPSEWLHTVVQSWPVEDKEKFMADQMRYGHDVLHAIFPGFRGSAAFLLNDHPTDWYFSNFRQYERARRLMSTGYKRMTTTVPTAPNKPAEFPKPGEYEIITGAGNLRRGAGTTASVIFTAQAGDKVKVLSGPGLDPAYATNYWWFCCDLTRGTTTTRGWMAWTGGFKLADGLTETAFLDQMQDLITRMRNRPR